MNERGYECGYAYYASMSVDTDLEKDEGMDMDLRMDIASFPRRFGSNAFFQGRTSKQSRGAQKRARRRWRWGERVGKGKAWGADDVEPARKRGDRKE